MPVVLNKRGAKVILEKDGKPLNNVEIRLKWDANRFDNGNSFDIDVTVFGLNERGKVTVERDMVFPGLNTNNESHQVHPSGAIKHSGDSRDGAGDGWDEVISVALQQVPSYIVEIPVICTIYDAVNLGLSFGEMRNAKCEIYDVDNNEVIATFDLDDEFDSETAISAGYLYSKGGKWGFRRETAGFNQGLDKFCEMYGVGVA